MSGAAGLVRGEQLGRRHTGQVRRVGGFIHECG
jgi:hypothetical protein